MADGNRAVPDGAAEVLGHRRRDHPLGGGDVGDPIERLGEDPSEAGSAWVVEMQRAHHTVEHLDVVGERFGLRVDDHERGLPEAVQQTVTSSVERAEVRRRVRREHRVRRGLDMQRDRPGDAVDGVVRGAGGCPGAA